MHLSKKDKKFFPLERLIYNYRYHPNRIAVSSNKINLGKSPFLEEGSEALLKKMLKKKELKPHRN